MKLSNTKIACISDLHFGVHQNTDIWHNISLDFAKWFKDRLIENGIKDIIISGDVFHNRNEISVSTLHVVNQIFNIWRNFNIIIIPGNHDAFYKDRFDVHSLGLLNGWDNITVLSEPTQSTFFDVELGFCPWAADYKTLNKCDIIFGHFEINNFKVTPYKVCDHGLNYSELLKSGNLIISGHFHYSDVRKYDEGTILYLGCPYEMYWGDCGDTKGFYILDIKTKNFEFIENTISPKHQKIKFSEIVKHKSIPKSWKHIIKNNIINFIIDVDIDPDKIDFFSKKIQSHNPLMFKMTCDNQDLKLEEQNNMNLESVDIPNNINEFVQMLDIDNKQDVVNYIIDIYNTLNK
jgi:DNA repair exonuclease SbcCD nuclease subunit